MPCKEILYQPFDNFIVVGSAQLKYNDLECWVWALSVQESFRGLGHGHKLMEQILAICRELGLPSIKLSCYTDNEIALNMYAKHGFNIVCTYVDAWQENVHDLQLILTQQDETECIISKNGSLSSTFQDRY